MLPPQQQQTGLLMDRLLQLGVQTLATQDGINLLHAVLCCGYIFTHAYDRGQMNTWSNGFVLHDAKLTPWPEATHVGISGFTLYCRQLTEEMRDLEDNGILIEVAKVSPSEILPWRNNRFLSESKAAEVTPEARLPSSSKTCISVVKTSCTPKRWTNLVNLVFFTIERRGPSINGDAKGGRGGRD